MAVVDQYEPAGKRSPMPNEAAFRPTKARRDIPRQLRREVHCPVDRLKSTLLRGVADRRKLGLGRHILDGGLVTKPIRIGSWGFHAAMERRWRRMPGSLSRPAEPSSRFFKRYRVQAMARLTLMVLRDAADRGSRAFADGIPQRAAISHGLQRDPELPRLNAPLGAFGRSTSGLLTQRRGENRADPRLVLA